MSQKTELRGSHAAHGRETSRRLTRPALALGLGLLAYNKTRVFTNFFDLYPPGHPYIQLYQQYRNMFGTANTVLVVVEVKNGTIFDDPKTVQRSSASRSTCCTRCPA